MGHKHWLAERRQAIVKALEKKGQLSVKDLSARFRVSRVTIRQDLQALSEQGLLIRTRGGALSTNKLPELSFDLRQHQRAIEKARIGQSAVRLINDGDVMFLDASTTAQALIPFMKDFAELTIITNGLKIAISLLDLPRAQVILPGGNLRRESISVVGQHENLLIDDINIRIGFFGARGVSLNEGLTDVNIDEVRIKRFFVQRCRHMIAVVDSSKWTRVAASTFATWNHVDTIITDREAPRELVYAIRKKDVEVILV